MWAAYFQADGEMRHTICVTRFVWTAEHEKIQFIERMTNPEVGRWWAWVEEIDEEKLPEIEEDFPGLPYGV